MHYNYSYDVMGRLKEKKASGRTLLSLSYDLNGNLTGQENVTGKVTHTSFGTCPGGRPNGHPYYPCGTGRRDP